MYTQIIIDRITTEIELIVETAHRSIMFEPMDKYTMINFQNMVAKTLGQLKSRGTIAAYNVDALVTPDLRMECWITVTPIVQVEEITISCTIDQNGLDVNTNAPELEIIPTVRGVYNYGD